MVVVARSVLLEQAKAARVVTVFNEIAPGVFVRAIQQPPTSRVPGRDVKRVSQMRIPAVNAQSVTSRAAAGERSLGELFGTALQLATQIEDAAAVVRHSVRGELKRAEVQAREFDRQLKEVRRCLRIR